MKYKNGASMITCLLVLVCFSWSSYGAPTANEQDVPLAKEKMQQLREVYREVQQAEVGLFQLIEQTERKEPLLGPTREGLKKMKARLQAEDHQRFQEYLNHSKDPKAAYRLYEHCKVIFGQNKFSDFLNDPNQERLIRKPMIYYFRHKAPVDLQALVIPHADPNDPNYPDDERLWQSIKQTYFKRAPEEYLHQKREYYTKEEGVPEWLPDYAGNMAFTDGMISWYESGILLIIPQDVRDAEERVTDLYTKIGRIYPRWASMRRFLAGENNPDNEAVLHTVQEYTQILPTSRRK